MGYTPPTEIDIGSGAIERGGEDAEWATLIDANNPANASGKIKTVEIYARQVDMIDVEVAIFYEGAPNTFTTRDTHYIGTVAAGAKRIFEVDLEVQEGDYIGLYWTDGSIYAYSEGVGYWYKAGDQIPCTDVVFTWWDPRVISIYGIGDTGEGVLTIGEAFSAADSLVKNVIKQLSEAFSIVDSWAAKLALSESFPIGDSISTDGIKDLVESFSVTDGIHFRMLLTQVFQIVDSVKFKIFLTEAVQVVDSLAKSVIKYTNEVLNITDGVKLKFPLEEVLDIVDSLKSTGSKLVGESLSVVDSIHTSGKRTLSEVFSVADSMMLTVVKEFDETLKIIDSVIKKHIMKIRKIIIRVRGGSYESDIELED